MKFTPNGHSKTTIVIDKKISKNKKKNEGRFFFFFFFFLIEKKEVGRLILEFAIFYNFIFYFRFPSLSLSATNALSHSPIHRAAWAPSISVRSIIPRP